MLRAAIFALLALGAPLQAREVVDSSAPSALSVTIYRDPNRGTGEAMNRDWPQGFAMISETRTVTLPPGEATIRFEGVAEGMVGVSAIVIGLPGGTIEKNRNAELLSPAALVNSALGNRVTITRTNPATGVATSESAIVRTRADGGLVLQTSAGFEAVRCAGIPETLSFDRIPAGLSAQPVFSIDTRDATGGTYQITLTYLAWGFDWQANYVATLGEARGEGEFTMRLMSWLTLLNDNDQTFADAELLVIAGALNVTSDLRSLADAPEGRPLQLTCYPFGRTADGSPVAYPPPPPPPAPPPPPMMAHAAESIVVTGARMKRDAFDSATPVAVVAGEEDLGDLKLYRVPEPVTVAAKAMKQVAFLDRQEVSARFLYRTACDLGGRFDEDDLPAPTEMLLVTKNEDHRGLGAALPQGGMVVFEPSSLGQQLVAEVDLRDYAVGQDIELAMSASNQVRARCAYAGKDEPPEDGRAWRQMRADISNANSRAVTVRVVVGEAGRWDIRWPRERVAIKDGQSIVEVTVPANATQTFAWRVRESR